MGFPNHGIQPIPNQSIVVFLAHPDTIDHEIEVLEVGNYIYNYYIQYIHVIYTGTFHNMYLRYTVIHVMYVCMYIHIYIYTYIIEARLEVPRSIEEP